MGRSVSTPPNAEVVCYQHHRSYWYCEACGQEVDSEYCPDDFSHHIPEYGDSDGDPVYCQDCECEVEDTHFDPHDVYFENDWDWDDFVDHLIDTCQANWPSLNRVDGWIGREDHVILENCHAQIGVSEYCGLVAVWIVPLISDWYPEHSGLAYHWIAQIEPRFKQCFGQLRLIGRASNGEAFFQRIGA